MCVSLLRICDDSMLSLLPWTKNRYQEKNMYVLIPNRYNNIYREGPFSIRKYNNFPTENALSKNWEIP